MTQTELLREILESLDSGIKKEFNYMVVDRAIPGMDDERMASLLEVLLDIMEDGMTEENREAISEFDSVPEGADS